MADGYRPFVAPELLLVILLLLLVGGMWWIVPRD